jgi:hypothetical protein
MALSFDKDTNNYVAVPHHDDLITTGDFTISIWMHLTDYDSWAGIFTKDSGGGANYSIRVFWEDEVNEALAFRVYNGSQVQITAATSVLNEWIHLIALHNSVTNYIYLYKNLTEIGSQSYTGGIQTSTSNLTMGVLSYVTSLAISGRLAEAAIWHCVLTEKEREQLYKPFRRGMPLLVRPDVLKGYWPLDDFGASGATASGADTIRDLSGNGHHGTPTNNPVAAADCLSYKGKPIFI